MTLSLKINAEQPFDKPGVGVGLWWLIGIANLAGSSREQTSGNLCEGVPTPGYNWDEKTHTNFK